MRRDTEVQQIEEQVKGFFPKPHAFRPFAIFDERLDCIRVVTRDCSVTEERVNELLTILEDNYPDRPEGKYVGFTIKGAKHFCMERGLKSEGPVKLAEILDAILAAFPQPYVDVCVNAIARPILEKSKIDTVELPLAA